MENAVEKDQQPQPRKRPSRVSPELAEMMKMLSALESANSATLKTR